MPRSAGGERNGSEDPCCPKQWGNKVGKKATGLKEKKTYHGVKGGEKKKADEDD